ncbi:hypothetical protein V8J88_20300 [Massilia sp. W12]|uniref:hypothetical protein n=1 Tax=Massilia sp. W12 TaxID=3126507 RepID=UPI0030D111B3
MSTVQAHTRPRRQQEAAGAPLTLHIERLVLHGLPPQQNAAQFAAALQQALQHALQQASPAAGLQWQARHLAALPPAPAAGGAALAQQVAHSVTQQLTRHCAAPVCDGGMA